MRELALTLNTPGFDNAASTPTGFEFTDLGSLISAALHLSLYIAGILLFAWMVWGIFQYLFAGGGKEQLAHARKRIIFAIFGFVLVVLAFTIQQFFSDLLPHSVPAGVTQVEKPSP